MVAEIWAIGIDLGATKAGIAQVDCLGNIHEKLIVPTGNMKNADEVVQDICDAIKELIEKHKIPPVGIGIGLAGQVDPIHTIVHNAPNLQWHDFPIGKKMTKILQLPVAICNDVHAAARGEWMFGAGQGSKDMVCIFIGTGIGGGIISGGKMLSGNSFTIGEIGHMVVDFKGPICSCGNHGCLEAYAGGASLARRAKIALEDTEDPILSSHEITGKSVQEAASKGSKLAQNIIDEAIQALIAGGTSIVNALNPKHLIFGGGVVEGMPHIVREAEIGIREQALAAATKDLEILQAKLKNDAGIIGSAALAIEKFGS